MASLCQTFVNIQSLTDERKDHAWEDLHMMICRVGNVVLTLQEVTISSGAQHRAY